MQQLSKISFVKVNVYIFIKLFLENLFANLYT